MSQSKKEITLEQTQELFDFLQGNFMPEGWTIKPKPRLTRNQAWSVIYYLQERLRILPDHYEKCRRNKCDSDLFNSESEGCPANYCEICGCQKRSKNYNCDNCSKM